MNGPLWGRRRPLVCLPPPSPTRRPAETCPSTPSARDAAMARPKLSHPGQPRILRAVLWVYEFFASLKLAVVLILSVAVVLAVATFVESYYNGAAVGFLIYHTTWFA